MKRLGLCALVVLVVAAIGLAGEKAKSEGKDYVGWVTDTHCGAKGAKDGHADCAKSCVENKDAKYAIVIMPDGKVYELDPQAKAAEHAGHHVKVNGTADGNVIKVSSIEMTGEQKGIDKEKEKEKEKKKTTR